MSDQLAGLLSVILTRFRKSLLSTGSSQSSPLRLGFTSEFDAGDFTSLDSRDTPRFNTSGGVDDGKSTLPGRLLGEIRQ
jgi:hypothetical protein